MKSRTFVPTETSPSPSFFPEVLRARLVRGDQEARHPAPRLRSGPGGRSRRVPGRLRLPQASGQALHVTVPCVLLEGHPSLFLDKKTATNEIITQALNDRALECSLSLEAAPQSLTLTFFLPQTHLNSAIFHTDRVARFFFLRLQLLLTPLMRPGIELTAELDQTFYFFFPIFLLQLSVLN